LGAHQRERERERDRESVCVYIHIHTHTYTYIKCGPGSSVGIATELQVDGPGSNPGGDEIFRQARPALGPTQPPVHPLKIGQMFL